MNKLNKDRIFAVGSVALALYLGYESFSYPAESAFFPRALSVLLFILSVFLFIRLSLKAGKEGADTANGKNLGTISLQSEFVTLKSAGLVFCSIIAYGLLMSAINYEAASVLFLAVMMFLLGFKKPLAVVGISVGLMLLLYAIFFKLLGVSRPESLLLQ